MLSLCRLSSEIGREHSDVSLKFRLFIGEMNGIYIITRQLHNINDCSLLLKIANKRDRLTDL